MQQRKPLDYRDPAGDSESSPTPSWLGCALAAVAWSVAAASFWFLELLVRAPYRPPVDMGALLTDSERAAARTLQVLCVIVLLVVTAYVVTPWVRRSGPAA